MRGLLCLLLLSPAFGLASLRVGRLLSSGAVLPAAGPQIWGTANPSALVSVRLDRPDLPSGLNASAPADPDGRWRVSLPAAPASLLPARLTVSSAGAQSLTIPDVRLGLVLLCSGQSNMAITLDAFAGYSKRPGLDLNQTYASSVKYSDQVRLFTVKPNGQPNGPQCPPHCAPEATEVESNAPWGWAAPNATTLGQGTKGNAGYFSAECWYAGAALADASPGVPIGLVVSAVGGSMIQSWMDPKAMAACPSARLRFPPHFGGQGQWWGGMVSPLINLRPSAVLWHQGEENADDAEDYACMFRAMINRWRARFALAQLPFVFVQLQPCGIPPDMRYAQASVLSLPHTGMASCYDLGDPDPTNAHGLCHSRYKQECGARLALQLLQTLSRPPLGPTAGPTVSAVQNRAGVLELAVANGDGLHFNGTKQCTICCGELAYPLQVLLSSGTWVYLSPKAVTFPAAGGSLQISGRWAPSWGPFEPLAVRYAWEDFAQCALYNSAQLPAPPFNMTIPPRAALEG